MDLMTNKAITTDGAPQAIGTYSQAIEANGVVYLSGQIPLDPISMELVSDTRAQIHQVFRNLAAVAQAANATLADTVKLTIYLTDLGNFGAVNEVMAEYIAEPFPARAAVQVSALPRGAQIEADAILVPQR
ncbi:MAG: reactive intermediate/imine deaminase [Gammaproteobacteria bacterium]|jgi:reactive intermediate/imine deaminase